MTCTLAINDLGYAYPRAATVFEGVTANLPAGQLCALMGTNGSGKTTLIKCLAGLLPGYLGSIALGGTDLQRLSRRAAARQLSLVPQECSADFAYLVSDMVLMGRAPYIDTFASPSEQDRSISREALAAVGLERFHDRLFTKLSGGERQLVLIARALAQDAPVMLLDEPTSHLDFKNQIRIMRTLKQLVRERGLLTVMATHDPNLTLSFSDRVLLLHEGRLLADGPPAEILTAATMQRVYGLNVDELRQDGRLVALHAGVTA